MDGKKIFEVFEVLINDCSNASYVMDYETEELVYVNQAMEKKFQIFEKYEGRKAYEVIPFFVDICGFASKDQLKEGEFSENNFVSTVDENSNFRSKSIVWEVCGRKFIHTKYFLAPVSDKRKEAENLFDRAISQCLEILRDMSKSPIDGLLELLGKYYECEQTYIYEFDRGDNKLYHRYLWANDGTTLDISKDSERMNLEIFRELIEKDYNFNKNVINIDNTNFLFATNTTEATILYEYDVDNITIAKLWDSESELLGVIGLSNRSDLMYDDRLLQAVSHFVMEKLSNINPLQTIEDWHSVDLLTGFFNRDRYVKRMEELSVEMPTSLGVVFVSINGLRATNEFLGYEAGDKKIKKAADILNEYFHECFYRVTGDEFIGLVEDCDLEIFEETIKSMQERLKSQASEPPFSFGHSWESGNYVVTDMIKVADTVMVINKQSFYAESFQDTEKIKNTILQDLFRAIEEDEFLVYLQPQVDLSNDKVVGAEALIRRFNQKENKMIFPDQFISHYEKNSVIRHVDLFVLRKVCRIIQEWLEIGKAIPISVNLSRVTLLEHDIVSTIVEILDEYQIPHDLIVIEITERVGLVENDVGSILVQEFKDSGFKISLDDFGCAYSNIVTLAKVEFDEVKIDKSLVDDVTTNPKNRVIVKNMLLMCNELENTQTLAEGIETREQADFLLEAHCHLGQGYLYSRPVPNEEFTEKYIKVETK